MSDLRLHIQLSSNGSEVSSDQYSDESLLIPDALSFEPGTEIRGTVSIESTDGPWEVESLEMVLFWVTSGIGTRDQGVAYQLELAKKDVTLPADFTQEINIPVPRHPYTYHGKLIKIEWTLGLYAKRGWFGKEECEMPIEIRPKLDA